MDYRSSETHSRPIRSTRSGRPYDSRSVRLTGDFLTDLPVAGCLQRDSRVQSRSFLPSTHYVVMDRTMPECDNCGSHVSERFVRVFADTDGRLEACPNCSSNAGIAQSSLERARGNA